MLLKKKQQRYEGNSKDTRENQQPSTLSVTTQVLHRKACEATPDGRKAQEYVADGALSAFPGTDENGPTGLMKSAAKIMP